MFGKNKAQSRDTSKDLDRPVDLHVDKRSKKGDISSSKPYRLVIENGQYMYEVEKGSGEFYSPNGQYLDAAAFERINENNKQAEKPWRGMDSAAPQSRVVGPPKLSKPQDQPEVDTEAHDDHVSQVRANQELREQGAKAQQANPPQAPQTKDSFTSKPDDGKGKKS